MNLGVVVRADHGGLAAQTYEVWRHLRPARALVVDLGNNARGGSTDPSRYDAPWCDVTVTPYHQMGGEAERFLDGLDVLYTSETIYDDRLYVMARAYGVKVVLHVMPELFTATDRAADVLWNPTSWRHDTLPGRAEIVPMPVALDACPYRPRDQARTFFLTTGEAMLDRNGSRIVMDALPYVRQPCRLLYRGGPAPALQEWSCGTVNARWLPPVDRYEQVIPDETDVLLMPRRYGGLCLPVQEAAARGIPSVMTNLPPQEAWMARDLLIPAHPIADALMKGGTFPVYDADPRALAAVIDLLVGDPDLVARSSYEAHQWAAARSWDLHLLDWQLRFAAIAR